MSDMAKVRELLGAAIDASSEPEVIDLIHQAVGLSFRNYVKAKAPPTSRPLTLADVDQILTVYRANPRRSVQSIADQFNCNPGRVSEVITGKHKLQTGEQS